MTSRIRITIALITVAAVGFFFFTAGSLARDVFMPYIEEEAPPPVAFVEPKEENKPVRLEIANIGVKAYVQHVGITKSGKMAVPSNYTDAGWYRYGTVPGEKGSAVMDGHLDNAAGLPGVFKRLNELEIGDEIVVETKDAKKLTFAVTSVESYNYKEVPLERLFNRNDKARLNLITCEGAWIQGEKTYDRRLVVFAELLQD
jgi:LPXTG-site transpeptidase (sortase) family protein